MKNSQDLSTAKSKLIVGQTNKINRENVLYDITGKKTKN